MRDVEIVLSLECQCGNEILISQPVYQCVRHLVVFNWSCSVCGNKFMMHIQEVKETK